MHYKRSAISNADAISISSTPLSSSSIEEAQVLISKTNLLWNKYIDAMYIYLLALHDTMHKHTRACNHLLIITVQTLTAANIKYSGVIIINYVYQQLNNF